MLRNFVQRSDLVENSLEEMAFAKGARSKASAEARKKIPFGLAIKVGVESKFFCGSEEGRGEVARQRLWL